MIVSITVLRLKSPFLIPKLIRLSSRIFQQLQAQGCLSFKTNGFWRNHYTMTTWKDRETMRAFVSSGAHREAMKSTKKIASEVVTLTLDLETVPAWSQAKKMLWKEGKRYPVS